jgi:Mg/Co/Ni transporter MgtE
MQFQQIITILRNITFLHPLKYEKVAYAYQELPHSEVTSFPDSLEEEKESIVHKMINFKTDTTNPN